MFGKYEISLKEATHVKNFLLKNNFVTARLPFFGNVPKPDHDKELALDFKDGLRESIKLGLVGDGSSYKQTNWASFSKPQLKVRLEKDKMIHIELKLNCAFSTSTSGGGVNDESHPREYLVTYATRLSFDQFFKM